MRGGHATEANKHNMSHQYARRLKLLFLLTVLYFSSKQIGNQISPISQLQSDHDCARAIHLTAEKCEILLGRPAPFATPYMVGREDKRTKNRTILPTLKNNAAAGYQNPRKIELLKGAGLLVLLTRRRNNLWTICVIIIIIIIIVVSFSPTRERAYDMFNRFSFFFFFTLLM